MALAWHWRENRSGGIIAPDERLPWGQTIVAGLQHAIVMFGAAVLAPLLMGFDPNIAFLFGGIGTLIFFVIVGGKVPSYLGSSFSFIGVVIAVTGYSGHGPNPNIPLALGGIAACGVAYAAIGLAVMVTGTRWVERLMPPAVTGAIVAVIGLNLAPVAVKSVSGGNFDTWIAALTIAAVGMIAAAGGIFRRVPVLLGALVGYIAHLALANGLGWGKPIVFDAVAAAPWFGLPQFVTPVFEPHAMALIAPVAIILVAENLGHIKAIAAITGRNLDNYLGRAFLGDGVATAMAATSGGIGVTTYAENIGVMAVTGIYSTIIFPIAGFVAILLGLSPKVGALLQTIPASVVGGLSIVVFGLIAATAGRIWVEARTDFSDPRNLITIAVSLTAGAGDLSLHFGSFTLSGIGTATLFAIVLYHLLGLRRAA